MKTIRTMLLGAALALVLATPVMAQADESRMELAGDIERTIAEVQAELGAIDTREASPDWMVFESQSQGLIQVDLLTLDSWIPGVQATRADPTVDQEALARLVRTMPELWAASVLLSDAPDWVLDAGGATAAAWLSDRFGHLQTPQRKAELYDAERARLAAELEALRRSREFFLTETAATEQTATEQTTTESAEVEEFCREVALGETLRAEDGSSTYLGRPIPPIEELPDWCRDALLLRLTGADEPIPTPPPVAEAIAAEPTRCGEDVLPWEADSGSAHGRWNGVWEYYGSPGLTLNQVGAFVCATYGNGDGWMKLAIVDDHTLKGRWYEGEHAAVCGEERDGTPHWGWLELHFDETFDSYEGVLAVCADDPVDYIEGERVR